MKSLKQIKEDVYKEYDVEHECDIYEFIIDEIAKRYATEYAKEALRLASEGLIEWSYERHPNFRTAREAILSENNLPKHR